MHMKVLGVSVGALLCGMSWGGVAMAQGDAAAPAQPALAAAPAAPAPQPAVPQGYVLVPVQQPAAQTQYDVQYPQQRGALPPGMELPYEDGDPIPPGYRLARQPRRGLVIGGSIMTGIGWGLSLTGAVAADFDSKSGFLVVPVLGPWLMLAAGGAKDRDCSSSSSYYDYDYDCGSRSGLRSVLVLDGLLQTAGAVMVVAGIAFPRVRLVREDVTVGFVPTTFGSGSYGLGAVGTF